MSGEIKCYICGGPFSITHVDEKDGRKTTENVQCLDHIGILEYLWNRHPNYDKYYTPTLFGSKKR